MAYNSAYTGQQIDEAIGSVKQKESTWDGKQDKITGQQGQIVGFDNTGKPVAKNNTASDVTFSPGNTGMSANDVQAAVTELFTSVSEGKSLLAGAITDKGVSTSANDTFQQMANNVAAIETGGGGVWYADFVKFLKEQGDMHVLNQEYPTITVMGDSASFEGFYGVLFEEIANPENTILIPWPAIDLIGSQNNSFYGDFFFDGNGAEIVVSNMGANYGFQIYNFSNTLPCNMYVFKGSSVTF